MFRIEGEIDLATSHALETALLGHAAATPGDLTLDCSEMTFIDSSGIKALVSLARLLRSENRLLHAVNVRANCRLVLDVSGVSDLLRLDTDDEERDDSGEIDSVTTS